MSAIRACARLLAVAIASAAVMAGAGSMVEAATVAAETNTAKSYDSAEAAVTALVEAARANNPDALQAVLGPDSRRLVNSGDPVADADRRSRFVAAYDEQHAITPVAEDRIVLKIGPQDWPLPIPLVHTAAGWRFDTQAGAQELIDRWIGRNEMAAIRTALAYVDAQKAFFALTGQHGAAQYAQRLLSSPGKFDGLYWPAGEGVPESPLEPLVAQARAEGYPVDRSAEGPRPYHGYYFRILTGQGANSPEGARSYISNGRMTSGFALIAWPALYGTSGIMSFIVSQDGIVFQKDLGPRTGAIAAATKLFDPDLTWARVDVVN